MNQLNGFLGIVLFLVITSFGIAEQRKFDARKALQSVGRAPLVYSDGRGHLFITNSSNQPMLWVDGKNLYVVAHDDEDTAKGGQWVFFDPRYPDLKKRITLSDDDTKVEISCGPKSIELKKIENGREFIEGKKYQYVPWPYQLRVPNWLFQLKDFEEVVYVELLGHSFHPEWPGYRLYKGKPGNLKEVEITNHVMDRWGGTKIETAQGTFFFGSRPDGKERKFAFVSPDGKRETELVDFKGMWDPQDDQTFRSKLEYELLKADWYPGGRLENKAKEILGEPLYSQLLLEPPPAKRFDSPCGSMNDKPLERHAPEGHD